MTAQSPERIILDGRPHTRPMPVHSTDWLKTAALILPIRMAGALQTIAAMSGRGSYATVASISYICAGRGMAKYRFPMTFVVACSRPRDAMAFRSRRTGSPA